jgi:hypothetical protein
MLLIIRTISILGVKINYIFQLFIFPLYRKVLHTYSALRIFNALPNDLLQLQNKPFKSTMRKYFVNAFYSVDEFLVHSKKEVLVLLSSSLFKFIGLIIHVLLISFVVVIVSCYTYLLFSFDSIVYCNLDCLCVVIQ